MMFPLRKLATNTNAMRKRTRGDHVSRTEGRELAEGPIDREVEMAMDMRELDNAAWAAHKRAEPSEATKPRSAPGGLEREQAVEAARKEVAEALEAADHSIVEVNREIAQILAPEANADVPPAPFENLSADQREAVNRYGGDGYEELNASLWTGSLEDVETNAEFSEQLSGALAELPRHEGVAYRGSGDGRSAEDMRLERYEPGDVVVENGFLSASSDAESEFGGEVLWVIDSKNGRDIPDALKPIAGEREVLFDHFSKFEVKAKTFEADVGPNGRWLIYMEEID